MIDYLAGIGGVEIVHTVARVAIGSFFAISGFHKLFNGARHASLVATFKEDKIPAIRFNEWWVPSVEFLGGAALVVGLLTPLAALGLFTICLVATCVDGVKRIAGYEPIDRADWLDDLLYLPEVCYLIILAYFIAAGGGQWALDQLII